MLKLLDKLEKSKTCWYLIAISLIFFLLRLPSLIEPNWYGDEGIYQVLGIAINNGHMLYSDIWDNKPPFLYLTYALFQGDQFGVRILALFVGLLTVWFFFSLAQKLFKKLQASLVATSIFTLLFATPLIEGNIANAENFMLLPIILAGIIIYRISQIQPVKIHTHYAKHTMLFSVGILLGVAFLFKIVALFDLAAFITFFSIISLPEKVAGLREKRMHLATWFVSLIKHIGFILGGFLMPLLITSLYFFFNNAFTDFFQATFLGNIGYVGYGNTLLIPQGFLILKILFLLGTLFIFVKHRNKLSPPVLFVLIWLIFSLFNTFFSQRPYTHYLLVLLPSLCLLIGLFFKTTNKKKRLHFLLILLGVLTIVLTTFKPYSLKKTLGYYQNAFLFVTGQRDVESYQRFFDRKTPRDYQLATFIKMHTTRYDPIFIWGDSAQIYALSQTLPINKFTVAYHIRQSQDGMVSTQKALKEIQPKFIIILSESPSFPFQLDNYTNSVFLDGAIIYEKIL